MRQYMLHTTMAALRKQCAVIKENNYALRKQCAEIKEIKKAAS